MRWTVSTRVVLGLVVACLLAVLIMPAARGAASGRQPVIVIPGLGGSEFTANSAFSLSVDNGHGGTFQPELWRR